MIFLGRLLAQDEHPFIVAEISCNHEGSREQAIKLVEAAKEAGADAVKIQVYTPDEMTINSYDADYIIKDGPWRDRGLYEIYTKTQTNYDLAQLMMARAKEINIPIFASVFGLKSLSWLETYECPAYKIASFEITDTDLIRKVAKTGKSVVISTGMASLDDIDQAVLCVNPKDYVLLHCTSGYPTKFENTNLWKIPRYQSFFNAPIGFSDHTTGYMAAQLACGLGAQMIEKHLSLGTGTSEDEGFSLTPTAFKFFAKACRRASEATWHTDIPEEESSRQFRRSLYAVKDIKEGEAFTPSNVRSIRPSYGLPANMYTRVICMKATQDIKAGTALKKEMIR